MPTDGRAPCACVLQVEELDFSGLGWTDLDELITAVSTPAPAAQQQQQGGAGSSPLLEAAAPRAAVPQQPRSLSSQKSGFGPNSKPPNSVFDYQNQKFGVDSASLRKTLGVNQLYFHNPLITCL